MTGLPDDININILIIHREVFQKIRLNSCENMCHFGEKKKN